jgi:signal transduction histidine kinase
MPQETSVRQRSSIESFLDEYQKIRFYLVLGAVILIATISIGGWRDEGSPAIFLVALGVMGLHAAWCRIREIRAPKAMLFVDSTMVGVMMSFTTTDRAEMIAAVAFLAMLVVLFSEGPWMVGLLLYNAAWYVASSLNASGIDAESLVDLTGSMFTVGATSLVIYRVRGWLGRLDANRSQMVGTVSHELRNNLTGMVGLTDVVVSMPDLQPSEAHELVAMAHRQALDATEIVEDLLTASRLEGSALTLSAGEVDVNVEVVDTARRFQGTGTEIGLSLEDDLPLAWADALRTRQVIRNLLSNAIRYGGPEIRIKTGSQAGSVHVSVVDSGDGVPAEDEATIFLPYRRSTKGRRDAASVGLGLWICRQLAHGMGGELIYRRADGYTEFILALPSIASQPQLKSDSASRAAHTVLPPRRTRSGSNYVSRAIPVSHLA